MRRTRVGKLVRIPPPLVPMNAEQRAQFRVARQLERRARALDYAASKIFEALDRECGSELPDRRPNKAVLERWARLQGIK